MNKCLAVEQNAISKHVQTFVKFFESKFHFKPVLCIGRIEVFEM